MLSARAICRLLIEDDELAEPKPPDDPNQLSLAFDPDAMLDPKREIMRYAEQPFRLPGTGPTNLYQRMADRLENRPRRKIDNHTYLIRNADNSIAARFHDTDVVTAHPDGKVIVDSGGWRPGGANQWGGFRRPTGLTTMDRINYWIYDTWQIYKMPGIHGEWYWYNRRITHEGVRYPYSDGDTIFPDGSLQVQAQPEHIEPKRRRT